MAAIKSYTNLEQSKKLSEILPLESADMCYKCIEDDPYDIVCKPYSEWKKEYKGLLIRGDANVIPCWSLAALLGVLPFHLIVNNQRFAFSMHKGLNKGGETYMFRYNVFNTDVCLYATDYYNNPIDACVKLILKLHELNLL